MANTNARRTEVRRRRRRWRVDEWRNFCGGTFILSFSMHRVLASPAPRATATLADARIALHRTCAHRIVRASHRSRGTRALKRPASPRARTSSSSPITPRAPARAAPPTPRAPPTRTPRTIASPCAYSPHHPSSSTSSTSARANTQVVAQKAHHPPRELHRRRRLRRLRHRRSRRADRRHATRAHRTRFAFARTPRPEPPTSRQRRADVIHFCVPQAVSPMRAARVATGASASSSARMRCEPRRHFSHRARAGGRRAASASASTPAASAEPKVAASEPRAHDTMSTIQEYIEKHDLSKKVEEALNAAVKARPEEPMAFMVRRRRRQPCARFIAV
jgi:hypothetical protein